MQEAACLLYNAANFMELEGMVLPGGIADCPPPPLILAALNESAAL